MPHDRGPVFSGAVCHVAGCAIDSNDGNETKQEENHPKGHVALQYSIFFKVLIAPRYHRVGLMMLGVYIMSFLCLEFSYKFLKLFSSVFHIFEQVETGAAGT
jgi:hypothetical protein